MVVWPIRLTIDGRFRPNHAVSARPRKWNRMTDDDISETVLQGSASRRSSGISSFPLWEADILRTPEFQHPVQCIHRDANLGRPTWICARSQTIADNPFEAADVGLNQSTPVVA
jgi:hypothetical protein